MKNDFTKLVQSYTSEKLAKILLHQKNDFQKEFIDAAIIELTERGLNIDELFSAKVPEKLLYRIKTDDELTEIFVNPDEYTSEEVQFAKREMSARNLPLDELSKQQEQNRWTNDDRKQAGDWVIPFGYVLCCIGGGLGIAIALIFLLKKVKNKDEESIYAYNAVTRKHAKKMLIIAVISMALQIFLMVMAE